MVVKAVLIAEDALFAQGLEVGRLEALQRVEAIFGVFREHGLHEVEASGLDALEGFLGEVDSAGFVLLEDLSVVVGWEGGGADDPWI